MDRMEKLIIELKETGKLLNLSNPALWGLVLGYQCGYNDAQQEEREFLKKITRLKGGEEG